MNSRVKIRFIFARNELRKIQNRRERLTEVVIPLYISTKYFISLRDAAIRRTRLTEFHISPYSLRLYTSHFEHIVLPKYLELF